MAAVRIDEYSYDTKNVNFIFAVLLLTNLCKEVFFLIASSVCFYYSRHFWKFSSNATEICFASFIVSFIVRIGSLWLRPTCPKSQSLII